MKNLQNAFLGFLVVGLVVIGAMLVPQSHSELLTVATTIDGVPVANTTIVYKVTYTSSMVNWLDNYSTPTLLLKNVDVKPETIRNAYIASGYSNIEVSELPL